MNTGGGTSRPARRDLRRTGAGAEVDSRDVRALILDATERLLADRRFETLSVADILSAAGVARGSFYFYFASKHAVLADLVRRTVASAHRAAGTWAGDESGAPDQALRRGTAEGSRLWREHSPVLRAIVENWQSDPELAALWTEVMDGFTVVAAERIQADRAAGLAPDRDDDPRVLASVLCWMSERAWYLAAIGHSAFTDEARLADALSQVWQAAIYGTPSSPSGA